jgi:hypothetical protein
VDSVKYFIKIGFTDSKNYLGYACCTGQLQIVKYLIKQLKKLCPVKTLMTVPGKTWWLAYQVPLHQYYLKCIEWTVYYGHLRVLRYLVTQGSNISRSTLNIAMNMALKNDYLGIVRYLIGQGCHPGQYSMANILRFSGGKATTICQYLLYQGFHHPTEDIYSIRQELMKYWPYSAESLDDRPGHILDQKMPLRGFLKYPLRSRYLMAWAITLKNP